jgi:hypothetical protein
MYGHEVLMSLQKRVYVELNQYTILLKIDRTVETLFKGVLSSKKFPN